MATWPRRVVDGSGKSQRMRHYCFGPLHGHRTDWRKREADQEQQTPVGVSESVFMEAEIGYALQVTGGQSAVGQEGFRGGVPRCWVAIMRQEPHLKARVIEYALGM